MISNLSKFFTVYLPPILCLVSLILSLIIYLAPSLILHESVFLLAVTPTQLMVQSKGGKLATIDGPSARMGLLGSCSQHSNAATPNCTAASLMPIYDLSVLPQTAPDLLSNPPAATSVFILLSILLFFFFSIGYTLVALSNKLGPKFSAMLDRPVVGRMLAWLGVLAFLVGVAAFLILRVWFDKAVEDFNDEITKLGSSAPQLSASIGGGFTMVWVAYVFEAIPVVCSLVRLNQGGKF